MILTTESTNDSVPHDGRVVVGRDRGHGRRVTYPVPTGKLVKVHTRVNCVIHRLDE
jgi:hypothetical protein